MYVSNIHNICKLFDRVGGKYMSAIFVLFVSYQIEGNKCIFLIFIIMKLLCYNKKKGDI